MIYAAAMALIKPKCVKQYIRIFWQISNMGMLRLSHTHTRPG